MTHAERELRLLHFQRELESHLLRVRGTDKAQKIALRMIREYFGAADAIVAVPARDGSGPEARFRVPQDLVLAPGELAELLAPERGEPCAVGAGAPARMGADAAPGAGVDGSPGHDAPHALCAAIFRRGRRWGSLVLRRPSAPFTRDERRGLKRVAATISQCMQRLDEVRVLEVRARIDRKIAEQIRPKDLFYQILHGLRSLTRYDHSATVFIQDESPGAAELVAEQIAWRKAKSTRIGLAVPLDAAAQSALDAGCVLGFDRDVHGRWTRWDGDADTSLVQALEAGLHDDVPARSVICAPLVGPAGGLGVLRVACRHPGSLTAFEAGLMAAFLPQAVLAIRQMRRAEHLERGLIEAEKKHAMASLARGVSHDVNNALGTVLPLVQQMLADLDEGRAPPPDVLRRDLHAIAAAVSVCRRIFGGMLGLARASATSLGEGHLGRAVDGTLVVLAETMRRHRIDVDVDVPSDLPPVRCPQGDLEQIVLNLATNARDAMASGGRLTVRARAVDAGVELVLSDTGTGIAADDLEHVAEPFYSTKRQGTGLGLSICRSLAWDMGGSLHIASRPGEGTTVTVTMPAVERDDALSRV